MEQITVRLTAAAANSIGTTILTYTAKADIEAEALPSGILKISDHETCTYTYFASGMWVSVEQKAEPGP